MDTPSKRFRVALSFPGEKREYVAAIAQLLADKFGGEEAILYDRYHTAEFARPNLGFYLPDLYHKKSDLIVVVLCTDYEKKEWCGLEWRAIFDLLKQHNENDIMFFRADDGEVRGIFSADGYVPLDAFTPDEAFKLILQRLAINEGKSRDFYLTEAKKEAPPAPIAGTRLPDEVVGRQTEVNNVVARLCDEPPKRVAVLGTGGVGKSTVLGEAFKRRREMAERFGARRFVVPCDGILDPQALWGALALKLDLEAGGDLQNKVLEFLAQSPVALALDNFETPWDNAEAEAEAVLNALVEVPALALAIGMRSLRAPHGWAANSIVPVHPLKGDDAKKVFLNAAGEQLADDPHLEDFLTQLDGLPLALTLIAESAQGYQSLDDLWERWQSEGVSVAQVGSAAHKDYVLGKSFDLSIDGPRMNDEARRFLSLLALLPDGVAPDDRAAIFPKGKALDAAERLCAVRLAYQDEARRLRLLAPLREHISRKYPPETAELAPLHDHFLKLVEAYGVEMPKGTANLPRLAAETGNVDAMLRHALMVGDWRRAVDALWYWGDFVRFTGLGSPAVLETARQKCHQEKWQLGEAECIFQLGDIALARSEYEEARLRYEAALPLYQRVGSVQGEANCIKSLGHIALRRSSHGEARSRYEAALSLYERVGNVQGEANCIRNLGDMALARSEYEEARLRYEAALPLYQGEGDMQGEANCIGGLGDIALERSEHEEARLRYEAALPLYQRVGSVLGEANCIRGLGDIAHEKGENGMARERYETALSLYERISEPYSIGGTHFRLAFITTGEERQAHLCAARRFWRQIGREDLVQKFLVAQFPDFDPNQCPEAEKGAF